VRRYTLQEAALAAFLNPKTGSASRQDHWNRARLKGSQKFQQLLERYVQGRGQAFAPPKQGFTFTALGPEQLTLGLAEWEIRSSVQNAAAVRGPYEAQRQRTIAALAEALSAAGRYDEAVNQEYHRLLGQAIALRDRLEAAMRELGGRQPVGREVEAARKVEREIGARQRAADEFRTRAYALPNVRRAAQEQAAAQLRVEMDKLWPAIHLRDDYYRLLGDAKLLAETGQGLLSGEEARLLGTMQPAPGAIDIEDIPALLWLHILVHGKGEISYDHIVVDEGQDFSPLQYRLLRLYSQSGSMTILGDMSQGIYAHRGVADWNEVRAALSADTAPGKDVDSEAVVRFETIAQNYRSTKEIVEFTNAVLKRRSEQAVLAQPFNRGGEPPRIVAAPDRGAMYQALDEDIRALLDKGLQNIGVIGKTIADCQAAAQALGEAEYGINQITSRDTSFRYQGGVVLLPVDLAKGIEFQAALVIDADEAHYDRRVDYDGRLLYVALTRALHVLNVYAVGKASGWLEG
jgi:DNA helicase-2/ATP-dependent DNA helicase PcrA